MWIITLSVYVALLMLIITLSNYYPEETPNPRGDFKKTGRYDVCCCL